MLGNKRYGIFILIGKPCKCTCHSLPFSAVTDHRITGPVVDLYRLYKRLCTQIVFKDIRLPHGHIRAHNMDPYTSLALM